MWYMWQKVVKLRVPRKAHIYVLLEGYSTWHVGSSVYGNCFSQRGNELL